MQSSKRLRSSESISKKYFLGSLNPLYLLALIASQQAYRSLFVFFLFGERAWPAWSPRARKKTQKQKSMQSNSKQYSKKLSKSIVFSHLLTLCLLWRSLLYIISQLGRCQDNYQTYMCFFFIYFSRDLRDHLQSPRANHHRLDFFISLRLDLSEPPAFADLLNRRTQLRIWVQHLLN